MVVRAEIPIGGMLGRASHKMRLLLDKVLAENNMDLNVEQFLLLKCLSFNDGINQQELSKIIDRDKTTIARIVSKMEKKNMVLRVQSKEDKRVNNIYLTNFGKEVLVEVEPHLEEINNSLKNSVSNEDFEIFKSVLDKLVYKIEEIENKL
jgi:DNA-binding MarR family transcriptional regulator